VRPWTLVWAKMVNCVLALAVSAQPILAQHCPCQCAKAMTGEIAQECDDPNCCPHTSDPCHHHHDSHACPSEVSQVGVDNFASITLGLCPCGCPRDCDCHLRHAPTPATPQKTEVRVAKQHQDATSSQASTSRTLAPRIAYHTIEIGSPRSAASLCAVLCRFTI
jgi:hypothetical protein